MPSYLLDIFNFCGKKNIIPSYEKAIQWIKDNSIPEQGIIVNSRKKQPYLEVTGYLIPTLLEAGEHNLAETYAAFLSYMQLPNGAFRGSDGKEYVFDTGQALKGLLAALKHWDRFRPCVLKAAEYIVSCVKEDGSIPAIIYENQIPEQVHVFVLSALIETADILDQPQYREVARRSINYYKNFKDVLNINLLTHFLAYTMDGFIEAGEGDFVRSAAEQIFSKQKSNGAIPAYPHSNWICVPGVAQFAIIGYKLGMVQGADKALNYLCTIQNNSGGFYGSVGMGADYFRRTEISWANKFFIDAVNHKIKSFFDSHAEKFPSGISLENNQLKKIIAELGLLENARILDAGCGKGRFAVKIKNKLPNCEVYGVDISHKLLAEVPNTIIKSQGNILNLPYKSGFFDAVFCVEALEHVMRVEKAIGELSRITKNNGKIVIIDKDIKKTGELKITDFEQWFDAQSVKQILQKSCHEVKVENFNLNNDKSDGLFLAWTGMKKGGSLDAKAWKEVIVGKKSIKMMNEKIRSSQFPVWIRPLLQHSCPGDTMLELGSGSGELSAILGVYQRIPFLLDYSQDSLKFSQDLFRDLGIKGHFYHADILNGIPLGNVSVDWVWSSGVLEHFSGDQIQALVTDSVRVARKGVMSLVPNANSIFYRIGKLKMEREGKWPYGREEPKFSMKEYFLAGGLKNIKEFSIGNYSSLNFFGSDIKGIKDFFDSLEPKELEKLNQGYLLFTCGEK